MPKKGQTRFVCLDCGSLTYRYVGMVHSTRKTGLEHCRDCGSTCLEMDSPGAMRQEIAVRTARDKLKTNLPNVDDASQKDRWSYRG